MNKIILMGRLTRDPDVRYSQGEKPVAIARFSLAVDRRIRQDAENAPSADFPSCIAFGKTGEFVEKYFHKGSKILLEGRIQTGSFTNKDGQKVYTTDVIAEQVEFAESKGSGDRAAADEAALQQAGINFPITDEDGFMNVPDGIDEELPFG